MLHRTALACLVIALSAGCPAAPGSPAPSAASGTFDPTTVQQTFKTDAFVRINPAPVQGTSMHPGKMSVYVDKAHTASYRKDFTGTLPEGTTVVKVSEPEGAFLAVMHKQPAGTDPAAGDWLYYQTMGGSVSFDGRQTKSGGMCHQCHQAGKDTDSLLGMKVFVP